MKVPKSLVYEVINGKPIYYRGYREVMRKNSTFSEIMGSSYLQSLIISCVFGYIFSQLSKKKYTVLTNEVGLHLGKNDNLSSDIAIYQKEKLIDYSPENYISIAPEIVIEVDTKADIKNFQNPFDYFYIKLEKLLNFGVEKVIWVNTSTQTVVIATNIQQLNIIKWTDEIQLLEDCSFSIMQLLEDAEIDLMK